MKSFFNEVLERNNLSHHDGRPLWKYKISEKDFEELKIHLSKIESRSGHFDPRDITLYYAEWWANEYSGGLPSKREIFRSIGSCPLDSDDFYNYAKSGAVSLGVRWIKKENKLYFRTLLLQGGLPINHMLNPDHVGAYTRFLKKVLEINPNSIEEFMYESSITSILPTSSRNEEIYESCLQIVEAIWKGNDEYLAILNSKGGSRISKELLEHKDTIDRRIKKSFRFKAFWALHKLETIYKIKLRFNFPGVIEADNFSDLIQVSQANLKSEYSLILNDILVCKFRKNTRGNYKVFWVNENSIYWDGQEIKPDIYLSSVEGDKYQFLIRFVDYPKLTVPTLWIQNSENEWILQKGKHCSQQEAFILYSDNWKSIDSVPAERIKIADIDANWAKFSNEYELVSRENESLILSTNKTSFEWFVYENKPNWIVNSNLLIVSQTPKIIVNSVTGDEIKKFKIYWRLKGEIAWKDWDNNLPVGCIEYKIIALESEEQDVFYNIGILKLEYKSNSSHQARINILNSDGLVFNIKQGHEDFDITEDDNSIFLSLKDNNKIPTTIKATVSKVGQNKKLYLDIVPPFHGVTILDQSGNKLSDKSTLLFGCLTGFRIYTPINSHNYYIKLNNTNRPDIKVRKKLPNGITPLREYEEIAQRLFRLTDAMDKKSSVTIELIDEIDTSLNKYQVQNYNSTITCEFIDEKLSITTTCGNFENLNLVAIPLDCSHENIVPRQLSKEENTFILSDKIIQKFIVVSEPNSINRSILLPAFVSTDEDNTQTTSLDRKERIEKNKAELEEEEYNDSGWLKVKRYYDICIEYELPFSTFDLLRASCFTPSLIAKMFCVLSYYDDNEDKDFIDKRCVDLEEDLGFSFHWVPRKYWELAIQWIEDKIKNRYNKDETEIIIQHILKNIQELINNSEPIEWFGKIADYVSFDKTHMIDGFCFNAEVTKLRQRLSERVLTELPDESPKILKEFQSILPVTSENVKVKILIKAPLAVALSISGKDESIWNNDEKVEIVRRNIKYAQWISADWYGKAILHSLSKLKNK